MASNTTKVETILTGDNRGALNAISGVTNSLTGLNTNFGNLGGSLTSAFTNPVIAIGAVGTALGGIVAHAANTADEISKMSQKIGISTEALSTLTYAADLSDVSIETLQKSVAKLSVNISAAQDKASEQAKTFQRLGISVKDADGNIISADETLLNLADKFAKMPDGIAKTTVAMQLFGKGGFEMIPLLNSGADGLRQMQDEARKMGLEISTNAGKQAEQFNDNLTRLKSNAEGFGRSLMSEVVPALATITDQMVAFSQKTDVVQYAVTGLGYGFKFVAGMAMTIVGGLQAIGGSFMALNNSLGYILKGEFSKAGEALSAGFDKVKKDAWATNESIKNLYGQGYQADEKIKSMLASMRQGNDKADKLKGHGDKLAESWAKQKTIIDNELIKQGLNPYLQKIEDISLSTNNLLNQYHSIQGAESLILRYKEAQIAAALKLNEVVGQGVINGKNSIPQQLGEISNIAKPQIDTTVSAFDAFFNATNEKSIAMRQSLTDSFGYMGDAANSFYQASGQKSKELFALQKGFNIAQAVMNTYEGATKALAQGGIWGTVLAAGIIASGLGMVATIASTQPGSTGGSAAFNTSIPSLPTAADNGNSTERRSQAVTINVYTNYEPDPDKFARVITPYINDAMVDLGIK